MAFALRRIAGAQPVRHAMRIVAFCSVGLLWAGPLLAALGLALAAGFDGAGMAAFLALPHWPHALLLSLATGSGSFVLAVFCSSFMVMGLAQSQRLMRAQAHMGRFLALPHVAFAVGLGLLISPSGWVSRGVALLTGWQVPPQIITLQDPYGLALMLGLVLKETPFLVWIMLAVLQQADVARMVQGFLQVGASLGHGPVSIWLRLIFPMLVRRILWPLLIVWGYGATVVDMALLLGPTQPATLSVMIWADLNQAELTSNQRGAAGAVLLTFSLLVFMGVGLALLRLLLPIYSKFQTRGPDHLAVPRMSARWLYGLLVVIYALVFVVLCLTSITALWPYPQLLPERVSGAAWAMAASAPLPLVTSLELAFASSCIGLLLCLLWFETVPPTWDGPMLALALAALLVPGILLVSGQYQFFLKLNAGSRWFQVLIGHLTPVFAYMLLVLRGPYRSFDARYQLVAQSLGRGFLPFVLRVKWPLLWPVLATSLAIGLAVSVGQYLPSQLLGAGRVVTLTTETIIASSGGNRAILASYSLLLWLVPAVGFWAAQRIEGRRTWL